MFSLNVSEALVGTYYRSGERYLDGKIVSAELFDEYDNIYKIQFQDEFSKSYHWATIKVVAG